MPLIIVSAIFICQFYTHFYKTIRAKYNKILTFKNLNFPGQKEKN